MDHEDFLINSIYGLTVCNMMVGGLWFWSMYARTVL